MHHPSRTHLVVIPSYNPGAHGLTTVRAARAQWNPVWVVVDGSTDGSGAQFAAAAAADPGLRVLVLAENGGKGAAVLHALHAAHAEGFTHALVMDSDGQHPAQDIGAFMEASAAQPGAMILGAPIFGADAPRVRVLGRKISNFWANFETLWMGIQDSLFGFRVYPIDALIHVMGEGPGMRRFDFDVEAAVRLCWQEVLPVNLPVPVRYFTPGEGGVSHFRYLPDNLLLIRMHARLFAGFWRRLPVLLARRARRTVRA